MKALEDFILGVPYLFLKKIPYAWIGVVLFWGWPPVVSGIILAIVLVGLLMMLWQERAWEARVIRENSDGQTRPFIDRPHVPRAYQLRNLAILLGSSGLVAWVLNGRIGLSGWQWFLLLSGFMLLYKDALLFGAGATYIISDQGIGIRLVPGHVDYRLFLKFHEIWQAARTKVPERIPLRWDVLTPQKQPKEGVLLKSARREGFSKTIQSELLVVPTDRERFLEQLEGHVAVVEEVKTGGF